MIRPATAGGSTSDFIKRYKKFSLRPTIPPPAPASSEEEGLVPGLYVRSFAAGLEETLTPYNHLILALEQVGTEISRSF